MGCVASKDAVETKHKLRSGQSGRGMFMPVQAQDRGDNGYHMVALTSSTYGILKEDDPTNPGADVNAGSLSNSHDAFYEKLKHFDVPDEMVTKSWSEVSRSLPKIPPPSKTDSPRRGDSLRRLDSPRLQSRGMDSPRLQSRGLDSPRLQSRGMDSPRLQSRGLDSPRLQSRGLDSPRLQSRGFADSPRLQSRGMDSPRQRASLRRLDSPRRLPSESTINDHETINTWELMDGLDEDGNILAKQKPKPVERILGSPVIKSFERSATFSTIHTLSELDSGDPSQAIAPGPAGNFLNISNSVDTGSRNEGTKPVKVMTRSVSTPVAPKRDEMTVRLTPSSPLPPPLARVASPISDLRRPRQPPVPPMTLTPEANAVIQEISNAVSKSLLPNPSPTLRSVGVKKGGDSSRPRQPTVAPMTLAPGVNNTLQEEIDVLSKSHRPPPSPLLRSAGTKQSHHDDSPSPPQPATAPMTPEVNDTRGGSNAGGKLHVPPPSPSLRSAGTRQSSDSSRPRLPVAPPVTMPPEASDSQEGGNAAGKSNLPTASPSLGSDGSKNSSAMEVRNRPSGSQDSKSPMVKAVDSPMSLSTKLEAEIERAMSEDRRVSGRSSVPKQPAAKTSLKPDTSRVRTVAESLRQEDARSQRVRADETSNQPSREVPRFASPIHVLSLAASFDLENRKNSMSPLDPKAPLDQSAWRSFSKQQSMPSSSLRAIPSSGHGVGLQSHTSAPIHGRYGSVDTINMRVGSQKDSVELDSDLLASFEEALEMLSTDEQQNVRDRKSGEATSLSGVTDNNRPGLGGGVLDGNGNRNKGANAHSAAQGEAILSKSPAAKGTTPRKIVKPDPWARFEVKCPPAGEDRVVLYTTSLRGIRKTFEACNNARFIFESFSIDIDERDISIHAEFRQELKELAGKSVPVPQAFIKGRYIGGMDIITQLHEDGTLSTLVDGLPPTLSRGECDGCGGVRFVPCSDCNGSTKVVNEAKEVVRCGECNENGLMRCPICY